MRVAVLIISLFLMLIITLQACVGYAGGSIAGREDMAQGGAVGLVVAFLYLIGAAFVLGVPMVSVIIFVLAGLLGLAVAATTPYQDMTIWGIVSFVLAAMAFLGRKRRTSAPTVEREAGAQPRGSA